MQDHSANLSLSDHSVNIGLWPLGGQDWYMLVSRLCVQVDQYICV